MPRDLIALVKLYEQAANRHNLDAIDALFAADAEYELEGQDVLRGVAQLKALHAYDAGINTQLEIQDCESGENTVTCRITERNDWLSAAGLAPILYPRAEFTFAGDRIRRLKVGMDEERIQEIGDVLHDFMPWLFDAYPAASERIFTPAGDFVYSRDNGELVVRLLREWRAGGGPAAHGG